jgi:type IV pilus assembly protein PilM
MKFDLFTAKAPPLFGLDISSSSVKMLELVDGGKSGYRVERYAIEPLPRDSVVDGNVNNLEQVGEAVKRAYSRLGTRTKHVAMAVPSGAVISKKIIVAATLREEELEIQVESEANQYIPFALDEVNLDFQVIGPAPNSPDDVEVLIAASRKEKIEDRVAAAESAGLKAMVVDIESFAIQTAFELIERALPDNGKDQNIAIVDVGTTMMNLNVLRNGQSIYMREQPFGGNTLTQEIQRAFGMSPEEAEAAKRTGGLPDNYDVEVLAPFMDTLGLEVARALQFFFTSTQFNQVNHILLAGGCAAIPGIDEVSSMVANPFANMALSSKIRPKNLATDAPSLMVACGLAMRRFDA